MITVDHRGSGWSGSSVVAGSCYTGATRESVGRRADRCGAKRLEPARRHAPTRRHPAAVDAADNALLPRRRGHRRSPRTSSRLSSNATTKKKSVMSPSLIHSRDDRVNSNEPIRIPMGSSQAPKNGWAQGELDSTRAATVDSNRIPPPRASMRRNHANGFVSRSTSSTGS